MKYLKSFKIFEEMDIDYATDNKMRDESPKMVEQAKKIENMLKGFKFVSKDVSSSDDTNKMREDAIQKVKEENCKEVYGIMKWSGQICQSFSIIAPADCIEILRIPFYGFRRKIYYNENPGKFCTLDVYNSAEGGKDSRGQSTSLYMMADGEVLFQWDDYEHKSKGKLAHNAKSI